MFSRLLKYAEKVYGLRRGLEQIRDRRQYPRIPTMRMVTALFFVVCVRVGSLNGIDEALRKKARRTRWHTWIGGDLPSADRLGEVAALLELDDVRVLLYEHHRQRKRKKTLRALRGGLRVLILDGHEMTASYLRCCGDCLTREITCKEETRIQYYHRYVMAVLKNEERDLIKDFRGLVDFQGTTPLRFKHKGKQCWCHDIEGFTSWTQLGHEVRVVRCQETRTVRRQRTKEQESTTTEWLWVTSLSKKQADTCMIVRIGHSRWDIENRGFNELVNQWHADHVFHHDTNAIVAILLLLFLAYNLFHVWVARGLKARLRERYTTMHFAKLIAAEFYYVVLHPT